MLDDAVCFKAVYIVTDYTDMRSGMERLAAVIEAQTGNRLYVVSFPRKTLRLRQRPCVGRGRLAAAVKALRPGCLLRGSLVSPSLEAAVMNAKYVNAVPLYHQEQEFKRYGLRIPRQNMTNWTIQCADRYLAVLYDYLHEKLYGYHILQADATSVLVNKDGRPAGSKRYMWVYRTGRMYTDRRIVLYEYQRTRNASYPREFLKDFSGIYVTDGYQAYHTIEKEREDLKIAECWSHVRRRYNEAVKTLPKARRKDSRTYLALTMIQAIYREEKQLKDLPTEERKNRRQLSVRPLVEGLFHMGT